MSTLAAARSALVTAVGASDAPIDPPACYVYSQGSDMELLGRNGVQWGFRVVCVGGLRGDDATSSAELAAVTSAKLAILWALAGWTVASVGPDQVRQIAGGDYLTADIVVTTKVDLV